MDTRPQIPAPSQVARRDGWIATALLLGLSCGGEPSAPQGEPASEPAAEPIQAVSPDPVAACIEQASGDTHRAPQLLRTLCSELTRTQTPGAVLSIAGGDGGGITLAVGYACEGQPRRALPDTVFRIGSLTKALTAAATVRTAKRGGLELEAPIQRHLPALRDAYAAVTWRQLLDHTSGLPDTEPRPHNAGLTGDALLSALTAAPPSRPAGDHFRYANAGYAIVGLALTQATGRDTTGHLRDLVAASGDAPRVAIAESDYESDAQACGHLFGQPFSMRDDFALFAYGAAWTFPAGGVVLSAPDLAAVARSIVAELSTEHTVATDEAPWRYALGMRRRVLPDGTEHWFHSGNTGDFAADLHVLPDPGLAVAVLANGSTPLRASAFAALAYAAPKLDLAAGPVGQ